MKLILQKPYIYIFIVLFIAYFGFVSYITDFWISLEIAMQYAATTNWFKLITSLILSLIIAALIGINGCYIYHGFKLRRGSKKSSVLASVGAVGGMAVGVCPICVGGILPLILGIFGITFSFAVLPLGGIEIQLAIIALLGFSYYNLTKKIHCEIPKQKKKGGKP